MELVKAIYKDHECANCGGLIKRGDYYWVETLHGPPGRHIYRKTHEFPCEREEL